MSINTYSPVEVHLIIAGYRVTGRNSIAVSRTSKAFTMVRGIRGKNQRVRPKTSSDVIFDAVIRTIPVNTVFSAVVPNDLMYCTGRLDILLKDKNGQSLFMSNEAYIDGYPDDAFTTELNNRRWTITCQTTSEWNIAGSEKAQESLFSNITNSIGNAVDSFME